MSRARQSRVVLLACCLAGLLWAAHAQAHARLVTADPAPNATVAAPPGLIQLHFSTTLAKKFSTFKLTDTDGNPVALMMTDGGDARTLAAKPAGTLTPGLYTVSWTAVSTDDGHKTSGSYSFTVR
jgi:copper resistance protein C